jgi:NitT/TauT family transport system ATP-binding protein
MPTPYPKCSPTEMMGLLVLLNDHKGSEDVARLGDDLDLEIDEILPALDFAEVLGLLKVTEGRATLTDSGRKLLGSGIRERKVLLREQLKRTTLFKALVRALESAPMGRLTESEFLRLIAFTTASADDLVSNIITWGRYTELFRWNADERVMLPFRARAKSVAGGGGGRSPPSSEPGPARSNSGASTEGAGPFPNAQVAAAF